MKEVSMGHPEDEGAGEGPVSVSVYKKKLTEGERLYKEGFRYMTGTSGYVKDYGRAASLLMRAFLSGNKHAGFALGLCYLKGHGVPQDAEVAVLFFLQDPCMSSYERLADCYLNGVGVPRSVEKAREYYLLALEEGSGIAQEKLDSLPKE